MIDDKIRYWFISYWVEGGAGCKVISIDAGFFPVRQITKHLAENIGRNVVITNFIEVPEETFLEFENG